MVTIRTHPTNGRIGFEILLMGVPCTPLTTKIVAPTGGVSPPHIMAIMKMMENCSRLNPICYTIGTRIGVIKRIIAVPSTKHPSTTQTATTNRNIMLWEWKVLTQNSAIMVVTPSLDST